MTKMESVTIVKIFYSQQISYVLNYLKTSYLANQYFFICTLK